MTHRAFADDIMARCRLLASDGGHTGADERYRSQEARERVSRRLAAVDAFRATSGTGYAERLGEQTFDAYQPDTEMQRNALAYARLVARDPTRLGALFTGPEGVGKTHLAIAIAGECVTNGVPAVIVSVPEALDRIRQAREQERFRHIAALATVPVLVLDDLGKEQLNPSTLELLFRVADSRDRNRRSLIVTTNIGLDSLENRMREDRTLSGSWSAIIGRIAHMTQARWVEVDGRGRLARAREERLALARTLVKAAS